MQNRPVSLRMIALLLILTVFAMPAFAARKDKKKKDAADAPKEEKKEKDKTIADITKEATEHAGVITVYQDKKDGTLNINTTKDQLGAEFIHFAQALDGAPFFPGFRGAYQGSQIVSIHRHFKRIEIVGENTELHFDDDSPLKRAASANVNRPVIASLEIAAEDETTGEILVEADDLFLKETLLQIKPSKRPDEKPGQRYTLGKLSDKKTRVTLIANYPENTDLVVRYVYENAAPMRPRRQRVSGGDFALTDDRYIGVTLRHSLIAVPDNDFAPRRDDSRIGFFSRYAMELTSTSATPYKDVIDRWNLVKKDPLAAVSEPVEPIVWWIENTTPLEFRETIKAATLTWNQSFKKAGFKNALQINVQPDDAEWDAGDIRYNVLRWTSSAQTRFSGYGPHFVNPRTGQVLGADVMLEWGGFTRRMAILDLYAPEAATLEETLSPELDHSPLYEGGQFGQFALLAMGASPEVREEFTKEFLYYLVLHELGHTLGLNHNMRATQMHSITDVHNKALTSKLGLQGSVMDYPAINFAPEGVTQGQYYCTVPGPYDDWAIEYGYSQGMTDPDLEETRLLQILARSTEPALAFGNDADDMRSPGKAIDPRVMTSDMSSDAVAYGTSRMDLRRGLRANLKTKLTTPGESYQVLANGFVAINREYGRQAGVISRYIGGVYIDRGFAGQEGSAKPYTPVEKAKQKEAMAALDHYLFSPDAFTASAEPYNYLQSQRRGFFNFSVTEDPKLHNGILAIQKGVLSHLLHPAVTARITDTTLYGNEYPLSEVMTDLTNAIFKADAKTNVNTYRQNLQIEYVKRLSDMVKKGKHDYVTQSTARYSLNTIKRMLATNGNNRSTIAHKQHVRFLIEKAMDDDD